MIQRPLEQIRKPDIDALITNGVAEGKTIEYKLTLPGNSDGDKKEFLADVSSFANASGGDLIFGVSAKGGVPKTATGLAGMSADAEILRLEEMIRAGVEPRIPGIHSHAVEGFADGPVLIVRIPKSWASPHMVTFKGTSRFYARSSKGKFPMDVGEVRAAFAGSEAAAERIRDFRRDRLSKVVADEGPLPLMAGPKIVLHLIPLETLSQPSAIDLRTAIQHQNRLVPIDSQSHDHRINLDGLVRFDVASDGECLGYAQLFRSGAIEAVDCVMLHAGRNSKEIPANFEHQIIQVLPEYLALQTELGLGPPAVLFLTLTGVRDYVMSAGRERIERIRRTHAHRVDRDVLLVPEVIVEDFAVEPATILRPAFDAVWQSAGFVGSPNYDEQGVWTGRS